ncbi:MAG: zinc-ribbon domain-containing protein [Sphingomicrobium sp.]
MILTCPECGTQYVVKDGAIPAGGRQVRCASCKHSWHQDAEEPETLALQPEQEASHEAEPEVPDASGGPQTDGYSDDPGLAGDPAGDGTSIATPEEAPAETSWHDESALQDDEFAPFGPRDYGDAPQRNALKPLLMLVLLVAAAAVAFWFLAPVEWKAKVGLAQAAETPLQLMMTHSDRQPLESGNELLAVTGRVINPTDRRQRVPPIQAQLRSNSGRVVYSWTIAPPASSLAPGASATFNSAEVNVPSGGDQLTLTLDAPRA